jgi:hypothetical protein
LVLRNDCDGDAALAERASCRETDETAADDENIGAQFVCLF